jgi:hypothetical protein
MSSPALSVWQGGLGRFGKPLGREDRTIRKERRATPFYKTDDLVDNPIDRYTSICRCIWKI